ncbi:MAG: DUF4129 domain-containing protein [Acidimicrobiales bacterium]
MYTEEVSRSRIARRLSILPATVGLIGIGLIPLGASAVGMTDAPRGWTVTAVSVSLVLATVMSGASFGLYLGLATLAVAGLAVGGPPTLPEMTALLLSLFVIHETVRFSLDARRPTRFGPGLISGYIIRSVVAGGLLVVVGAVTWQLTEREPPPPVWIPIAIAVAGLPLFARHGADLLDRIEAFDRPALRAASAATATTAVLAVVVIGAQARTGIESTAAPPATTPTTPTTTRSTTVPELVQTDPATLQRVLTLVAVIIVVLVFGVLYLALRRPEALFELDELDADDEDTSFGIALPGQAEQDDEIIEVDDQDLASLLQDLQLEISLERDPGRAIRFGYANIERSLGELELTRDEAETEREFLARALPTLGSAGSSMSSSTDLFERARFGHEQIDESMRQTALTAVGDLLAEVTRQAEAGKRDMADGRLWVKDDHEGRGD